MPVETRAMKRAREARGSIQTVATTATATTTAATTTTTTTTTSRAPRKKAAGPKGEKRTKGKSELNGKKGVDKVQKSTRAKKGGIKAVRKAKQRAKAQEMTDKAKLKTQENVSEGKGKEKEAATAKADKTDEQEVKAADKGKGKETAIAVDKGKDEVKKRFTRADLQEAGALESDTAKMSTLNNDIHPIWGPEKFRFSSGTNETERAEAYAAISPALRLASLWIEKPQYEKFWATMWHGQYAKPGTSGRLMRISLLSEDQLKSLKEADSGKHLTWKNFQDFASLEDFKCEWRFGPQALGTWAQTEEGIDGFSGSVTTLHDGFERLACSPQPSTTTSERLRFYFFLAINLGRELIQHICRFKHRAQFGDKVAPLDRSSVLYQTSENNGLPLDVAWDDFMFKGPIFQINSAMGPTAPYGLAVHHFRPGSHSARVYMPVRVEWISERFSRRFWSAHNSDEDRTLPGLPDRSDLYAKELVIDEAHWSQEESHGGDVD